MKARRDVYQAIADPTRRAIITLVAQQPQNVNAIAAKFDMTRQAVSLHLGILAECGLISITSRGRDRFCEAELEQLDQVADWVTQSKKIWIDKFEKLENYLTTIKRKNDGK